MPKKPGRPPRSYVAKSQGCILKGVQNHSVQLRFYPHGPKAGQAMYFKRDAPKCIASTTVVRTDFYLEEKLRIHPDILKEWIISFPRICKYRLRG